jgi:hypothetical protein
MGRARLQRRMSWVQVVRCSTYLEKSTAVRCVDFAYSRAVAAAAKTKADTTPCGTLNRFPYLFGVDYRRMFCRFCAYWHCRRCRDYGWYWIEERKYGV